MVYPQTKEENKSTPIKFFVIAVVLDNKNRILGVKKKLPEPFLELFNIEHDPGEIWFTPTDCQIIGETRESAAERIVLQETGYKVRAEYQIPNTLIIHHSQKGNSFAKISVLCSAIGKDENFQKPEYVKEIKWFTKEELWQNTLPEIREKWPESLKRILSK
jgi:ADP-ribose pyrophosphatase YjhB (NUDIX family)